MKKELLIGTFAFGLMACGGEETADDIVNDVVDVIEDDGTAIDEFAEFEFELTIANMPTPVEYIAALQGHEHLYDASLVVPVENAANYISSSQQAIGFGMYLTDLSYMAETGHTESLNEYFNAAHDLADGLGAAESFERIINSQMEQHSRDSLQSFVHSGYNEIEAYLTTEERLVTASELLIGSWLEGQFIITRLAIQAEHEDIRNQLLTDINEQKLHLNNLIDLMNAIQDEALLSHIAQFENLKSLYHSFADQTELTDDILSNINAEITALRESIL